MVRDWRPGFLDALSQWGNIVRACKVTKVGRTTVHLALKEEPDFKAAADEAITSAREHFEAEAIDRVMKGGPIIFRGRALKNVRQYNDKLLVELLRACWPEKWGRRIKQEFPQLDRLIREDKLTTEQLRALADGVPPAIVLAMVPKAAPA